MEVKLARGRSAKELLVLGVGPRPATFDELHAEMLELLGHPQLVVYGERESLLLAAVAKGGVVDVHRLR
jgi:hypothetical protein